MTSELLIIRSGTKYIRLREGGYELCEMNKASVFPLTDLVKVKEEVKRLIAEAVTDVRLHKLTICEEPYEEK